MPAAFLLAGGLLLGFGNFVYPYLSARDHLLGWILCVSLPVSAGMVWAARRGGRVRLPGGWLVAASFGCALAVEAAAETWWPNSADEYGYVFLARTLLGGRLWNPAPPAPEIFEIAWTYVRDGKWFSQYPPAWPALLAPFLAAHAAWLVNPLLTGVLAALLLAVLRRLGVDRRVSAGVAAMLMFSPFVLFNGASLFAHTLTAVLVLAIVRLQLSAESKAFFFVKKKQKTFVSSPAQLAGLPPVHPADANARNAKVFWSFFSKKDYFLAFVHHAATGALFGLLLLTRYDVFVLVAAPFVLDRLWFRRAAFLLQDAPAMAAGGLPLALVFMAYNHAFTGQVLKTPYAWASQGAHIGLWGKHVVVADAVGAALLRTAHWAGELAAFTSPVLIGLVVLGVVARVQGGRLRWFDTLLPVAVGFYFLYPANGGHEFGPRYWFFAWPTAMLSVATGLGEAGWLRVARWRLDARTLAAAHLPVFLGMAVATSVFTHLYVDARRQVEGAVPPGGRGLVLIPTRALMLTRWQSVPITAHSADFCRNGTDTKADVLYGRADNNFLQGDLFTRSACAFAGRSVYLWRAPGVVVPVDCGASGAGGAEPGREHAG